MFDSRPAGPVCGKCPELLDSVDGRWVCRLVNPVDNHIGPSTAKPFTPTWCPVLAAKGAGTSLPERWAARLAASLSHS